MKRQRAPESTNETAQSAGHLPMVSIASGQEGIFQLPNLRWQVLFVTGPEQLMRVCTTFADAAQASAAYASLAEMHPPIAAPSLSDPQEQPEEGSAEPGAAAVVEQKVRGGAREAHLDQRDLKAFVWAQEASDKFNRMIHRDRCHRGCVLYPARERERGSE
jgi:hypothetical protein